MGGQFSAFFANNRTAVLGAGAAAVAGLALMQRRRKGTPAGATAGATVPGTIPASAIAAAPSAGYNSTSYDLYNALQPELDAIRTEQQRQTTGGGITSAPPPIASTLYAPSGSGQLVQYNNGVYELQSDGTLFGVTMDQWAQLEHQQGAHRTVLSGNAPTNAAGGYYDTKTNLATRSATA